MNSSAQLVGEIVRLADDLPLELVERLGSVLDCHVSHDWDRLHADLMREAPHEHVRARLARLLRTWQTYEPTTASSSVALALRTLAHSSARHRTEQVLELVWTGPESRHVALRRTDEALLQLIGSARSELLIVSFAVYKAKVIFDALLAAARRGAKTTFFVEAADGDKVAFKVVGQLPDQLLRYADVYTWPIEKRLRTPDNKYGALHAKVAVADENQMLVSSANLTHYAMSLNMEMGLLIRGGEVPARVAAHFRNLIEMGIFERVGV